ncbi:hypothetical protein FPOAC2_03978 [Fusarium poae]
MYVRVLRTYGTTHNVPNEVICGPYLTSTELYKISAILSSMRVASKRCRLSKLTRPSFGDSLSTLAGLTARKASDTGAVTARRSLQRPLLGGRKSTSLRVTNGKLSSDKSVKLEITPAIFPHILKLYKRR